MQGPSEKEIIQSIKKPLSQQLAKQLSELEAIRVKRILKRKIVWIIFGVLVVAISYVFVKMQWILFIPVLIIVSFIVLLKIFPSFQRIQGRFKSDVLEPHLNQIPVLSFDSKKYVSKVDFNESKLYSGGYNKFVGEDLFELHLGKTKFHFSDLHVEHEQMVRNSDGDLVKEVVHIFRGIFMVADFNKHLKSTTIVLNRNHYMKSSLSRREYKVELENIRFEKKFDVYSFDPQEARYILTPSMMERILKIESRFGQALRMSFKGSNVYMGFSNGHDHFEASSKKEVTEEQVENISREIIQFVRIIEILDLNRRIWTKK